MFFILNLNQILSGTSWVQIYDTFESEIDEPLVAQSNQQNMKKLVKWWRNLSNWMRAQGFKLSDGMMFV